MIQKEDLPAAVESPITKIVVVFVLDVMTNSVIARHNKSDSLFFIFFCSVISFIRVKNP